MENIGSKEKEDNKFDLSYVLDVSKVLSDKSSIDIKWLKGVIEVANDNMWIPNESEMEIIPLSSIELIGRKMPATIENQLMHATKYSNFLVVDHKKKSMFGGSHLIVTTVFAGTAVDIRPFKNYLLELLGFSASGTSEELESEEIRLLCLIEFGIKDVDILLPIFDSNQILLNHALKVLKNKEYVDENAIITPKGLEYVEKIKSQGGGKLGKDVNTAFENVMHHWKNAHNAKQTKPMNKVIWKNEHSTLSGKVDTTDLWQYIPIKDIKDMVIEENDIGNLHIYIRTKSGVCIDVEPLEKSIGFALYGMLDKSEDMHFRIMNSMYLGIVDHNIIAHVLGIELPIIEQDIKSIVENGLIDSNNNILPMGMDVVRDNFMRCNISG
ncbi:MAG: hypothetical protein Q7J10_09580 [Methanosarcinaceae archaeon]|nr:hypothetical protein [Methanosarcinaceae archaeon]